MLQEVTNKVTGTQRPYIYVKAPTDGPYHLLPNLIIFDPIGQLKLDLKCEIKDQRHENAKIVPSKYWTDYSIQTPRLVYGSTRNAYLICRLYKCKVCKTGLIRATYPLFLKQLPQFPVRDFIIYHDSAVTVSVYNRIITGKSLSETIQRFVSSIGNIEKAMLGLGRLGYFKQY